MTSTKILSRMPINNHLDSPQIKVTNQKKAMAKAIAF